MRADRIEVTQEHDGPVLVRRGDVRQDALVHVLGPAVRIGAAGGHGLIQRHVIRNAVHRRGGAEDEALHAVLLHRFADGQRAVEVVAIVFHRLGHGLADGLVRRKVDDRIDLVFGKDLVHRRKVAAIRVVELHGLSSQLLHALKGLLAAVVEVVDDNNAVARVEQLHAGV